MAANSISADDLSLLSEALDVTRLDRTQTSSDALFEIMRLVRGLVGASSVCFLEHDCLDFTVPYMQYLDDDDAVVFCPEQIAAMDDEPGLETLMEGWWTSPCSLIERTGASVVSTIRSWYSARQWAEDPVRCEYLACDDQLLMGFPVSTFRSIRILLPRETGPAFGDREITLMKLLLPHLQPLMRSVVEGAGIDPSPVLTTRQREVLDLVRLGMPNKRIARILGISETTVRTHLENIFKRLGVESRTAAARVAFDSPTITD
jgi:DNA-binding CsgD family transcriptional regulator